MMNGQYLLNNLKMLRLLRLEVKMANVHHFSSHSLEMLYYNVIHSYDNHIVVVVVAAAVAAAVVVVVVAVAAIVVAVVFVAGVDH